MIIVTSQMLHHHRNRRSARCSGHRRRFVLRYRHFTVGSRDYGRLRVGSSQAYGRLTEGHRLTSKRLSISGVWIVAVLQGIRKHFVRIGAVLQGIRKKAFLGFTGVGAPLECPGFTMRSWKSQLQSIINAIQTTRPRNRSILNFASSFLQSPGYYSSAEDLSKRNIRSFLFTLFLHLLHMK